MAKRKDSPPPADEADADVLDKDGLRPQVRLFVMYYCGACEFNGTKAAEWAGYSKAAAPQQASRLLSIVKVQQAVKAELEKRAASHDELVSQLIENYTKLAFSNIGQVCEFNGMIVKVKNSEDLPAEALACVKKVGMTKEGVAVEMHDKRGAMDSLAKILGMLTEDFRLRDQDHESIVEKLYKKRMAEREAAKNEKTE